MLKVVLDTNVFISSLLVKRGLPAHVLDAWRERRYLLVTSPSIIAEIRTALDYPRIQRKYAIADQDIEQLLALLEHDAILAPGNAQVTEVRLADPEDEGILACAVEVGADLIVSGDRHLLDLGVYQGIPILTVREFLERLGET